MSEIGKKMFLGASLGAGVGFGAGAIYGAIQANGKIEQLPRNSITVPAHDVPMFDTRVVGEDRYTSIDTVDLRGSDSHSSRVTARYPVRGADGSLRMQHIPERQMTDHGTPVLNMKSVPIQEPADVRTNLNVSSDLDKKGVNIHNTTTVTYKTIGYYDTPEVKFETGVSKVGHILGYGAAGAAAGAIGGAILAVVTAKALAS